MINCEQMVQKLNSIALALSQETNTNALLERIVVGCKQLTHADAGTLYLLIDSNHLKFEIVRTDSKNFAMGGTSGKLVNFPLIPLYDKEANAKLNMVVVASVIQQKTISIDDAYSDCGFDLSGTHAFDKKTGYHSQSILTIPMKDHHGEILGAIQLINTCDEKTGKIIPFSESKKSVAESLTSMASVALSRKKHEDSMQQYVNLQSCINKTLKIAFDFADTENKLHALLKILSQLPIQLKVNTATLLFKGSNNLPSYDFLTKNFSHQVIYFFQQQLEKEEQQLNEVFLVKQLAIDNNDYLVAPLFFKGELSGLILLTVEEAQALTIEDECFIQMIAESIDSLLAFIFKS